MHLLNQVDKIIDEAPLRATHIRIFILCALVAFVDGIDAQLISVAAPAIAKQFGLSKTTMGLIFSAAGLGGVCGVFLLSPLADRFGRKPIACIALCIATMFTFLTALVANAEQLMLVRLFVGIGTSATVPCILSLSSEYAPNHLKGALVAAVYAAVPLGGATGGLLNGYLLSLYPWQVLFEAAGIITLVILLATLFLMPESVRYLANQRRRPEYVQQMLRKLSPTADFEKLDFSRHDADDQGKSRKPGRVPLKDLFSNGMLPQTLLLWALCFFVGATTAMTSLWIPSLLVAAHFSLATGGTVLAIANVGCTASMAVAGRLLDRFGPVRTLAPPLFVCGLSIIAFSIIRSPTGAILAGLAEGICIGVGASGMYALAAKIYDTHMRSTGIAYCSTWGRLAVIASPNLIPLFMMGPAPVDAAFIGMSIFPMLGGLVVLMMRKPAVGKISPRHEPVAAAK